MKTALIGILGFVATLGIAAVLVGQLGKLRGQRPAELGTPPDSLRPVKAGALNAVSSQSSDPGTVIAPISFRGEPKAAFKRLEQAVASMPDMQIIVSGGGYLYAEAQTPILRFVDDVEFQLDAERRQFHVRSSSRLGRRDFGVNRARLERIRTVFIKLE